jgi:hypothetical protein
LIFSEVSFWGKKLAIAARYLLRAGMTASRLNHRERVIPALTELTKAGGSGGLAFEGVEVL